MTPEEDAKSLVALDRYRAAAHAIQTGVGIEQEAGCQDGTPKHLRTGLNLAKCEHAGLVKLLIAKGLFTEPEYFEAIADMAEQEKATYEERLSAHYGKKITLG